MNASPPAPMAQNQQDRDHLNLLSIFHYVLAGLGVLGGLFMILHFFIMNTVMAGAMKQSANSGPQPPPEIFMIMKAMYVVIAFIIGVGILLNLLSAIFLRQRRNRVFSMVVAGINCLQIPLGTTLGIFTFIVLMRESVRELYERTQAQN